MLVRSIKLTSFSQIKLLFSFVCKHLIRHFLQLDTEIVNLFYSFGLQIKLRAEEVYLRLKSIVGLILLLAQIIKIVHQ